MNDSKEKLKKAIQAFPLDHWLSKFTKVNNRSAGDNVYADCPICKGKKTLGVHLEKKLFHCFRCDEGGHGGSVWNGRASLPTFVRIVEHCSFWEAVKIIYKLAGYGTPIPRHLEQKAPLSLLPEGHYELTKATSAWKDFIVPRDLEHLHGDLYLTISGRYSGRIIFPCYHFGEMIGFEAKTYTNQTPKSLFPEWMDTYSYFYTTDEKLERDFLVITESVVDAETLYVDTIGLFGSSLRDGQLARLVKLKEQGLKELFWMLDADAMKKQVKAILTKTKSHFDNWIIPLPQGEDPNSLGRGRSHAAIADAIEVKDDFDLLKIYANSLL